MVKCIKFYEEPNKDSIVEKTATEDTVESVIVGDKSFMTEHFLTPIKKKGIEVISIKEANETCYMVN